MSEEGFRLIGYFELASNVLSLQIFENNGKDCLVALLKNNTIAAVECPAAAVNNRMEPIPQDKCPVFYRKIDNGSSILITNSTNGDIFVTGKDKWLKKYDYPNQTLEQIDWKSPPAAPSEEIPSHAIGTNCFDISSQFKFMATGGKDG